MNLDQIKSVDYSELSSNYYQRLKIYFDTCVPVVDMVSEKYSSFITTFLTSSNSFNSLRRAVI